MNLVIATRKSKLAQVQTEKVIALLKEKCNLDGEKLLIETQGDKNLDVSLDKIGGKGVFVKDIEIALMEGRAHAAVHSMKDVPFALDEIFEIVAIPEREDVRDAYVSMNGVSFFDIKGKARIGTSSIRRAAQIKLLNPEIEIVPIRGNVQTRIDKIKKENLDGILLAAAGLKRLGMENIITDYFDPFEYVPAVGQGALGIEIVSKREECQVFKALDSRDTRICVEAERQFMKILNGGCHTCIGAHAFLDSTFMYMVGIFDKGGQVVKKDVVGSKENYIELGTKLAEKIINA